MGLRDWDASRAHSPATYGLIGARARERELVEDSRRMAAVCCEREGVREVRPRRGTRGCQCHMRCKSQQHTQVEVCALAAVRTCDANGRRRVGRVPVESRGVGHDFSFIRASIAVRHTETTGATSSFLRPRGCGFSFRNPTCVPFGRCFALKIHIAFNSSRMSHTTGRVASSLSFGSPSRLTLLGSPTVDTVQPLGRLLAFPPVALRVAASLHEAFFFNIIFRIARSCARHGIQRSTFYNSCR